jgi:hypothetical protein
MLRALKVVLIVFGVVEILLGLLLIILPDQAASMSGVSDVSGYTIYTMASLGVCLIVPGIFLIMAARDPLRHIYWVKFAIAWCAIGAVAGLYSVIKGDVEFSHAGMQIIMDAVFAAVFLFLYPYKAIKSS